MHVFVCITDTEDAPTRTFIGEFQRMLSIKRKSNTYSSFRLGRALIA